MQYLGQTDKFSHTVRMCTLLHEVSHWQHVARRENKLSLNLDGNANGQIMHVDVFADVCKITLYGVQLRALFSV